MLLGLNAPLIVVNDGNDKDVIIDKALGLNVPLIVVNAGKDADVSNGNVAIENAPVVNSDGKDMLANVLHDTGEKLPPTVVNAGRDIEVNNGSTKGLKSLVHVVRDGKDIEVRPFKVFGLKIVTVVKFGKDIVVSSAFVLILSVPFTVASTGNVNDVAANPCTEKLALHVTSAGNEIDDSVAHVDNARPLA
jgi:hypothetical protein